MPTAVFPLGSGPNPKGFSVARTNPDGIAAAAGTVTISSTEILGLSNKPKIKWLNLATNQIKNVKNVVISVY